MANNTYRAAGWVADDRSGEVRLTGEHQKNLSDEELFAEARAEAEREGLDLSGGEIVIGDWTD